MEMKEMYYKAVHANWITEPTTDTQYCIEETGDTVTIKIQGSISVQDWIQNFSFWKRPYKHMEHTFFAHAGFLKKYKAIRDPILKAGRSATAHGKTIQVLGYSQGAGIGYLVVEDLRFHYPSAKIEAYMFGTPRAFSFIGGKILKERLSGITRVENGNDIVTRIPFVWMFYRHYGKLVHIGKKRNWFRFSIEDHLTYYE